MGSRMARHDGIISWIWILFGIGLCLESWIIGLGSLSEPGTGFMPFIVGLGIIILAILHLLESAIIKGKRPAERASPWSGIQWKPVVYTLIVILAYILMLPKLGYLIATSFAMIFLLKSGKAMSWTVAIFVGILTSAISYLIFGIWLNVSFPRGLFHF